METPLLERIARGLRAQHNALVGWMSMTTPEKQAIRLGPESPAAIEEHVRVLEGALQKAEEKTLGVCTVCHESVETHLLETNYAACVCIEHLSGVERERLEAELLLSQKVQQALLPRELPTLAGWEIAAFSQPASIVGGDYFDVLRFQGGSPALVIADVMGKGMPASLLMASLQASLRIILPECSEPEEVLLRLNRIFHHNINLTKFVSIVIIRLDLGTGEIRYANAGHHPPYIVREDPHASEPLQPLRPTGAAIGLTEEALFAGRDAAMGPGDQLVLYTDGFVEAMTALREEYGDGRLRAYLRTVRSAAPAAVIRGLRESVRSYIGGAPPADDMTILVCRRQAAV